VGEFRATNSAGALKKLEALDKKVRDLGIPGTDSLSRCLRLFAKSFVVEHPAVVGALQSFQHALNQMRMMAK